MRFEGHYPAAAIAAFAGEMNYAALFHQLKGSLPKMQMKNFRLAGQQIVTNAQTFHGVENLLDVSRRDIVGQFGSWVVALFDGVQNLDAQFRSVGIWLAVTATFAIERSYAGIEIPAIVIKRSIRAKEAVQRLDLVERHVFYVHEANHDVGDLDAGVVDVVLHFDAVPAGAQYVHKGVAQN